MLRRALVVTVLLSVLGVSVATARPFRWSAKNPPTVNGLLPSGEPVGAFCKHLRVKLSLKDNGEPSNLMLGESEISWYGPHVNSVTGRRLQAGPVTLVEYGFSRDQVKTALGPPLSEYATGAIGYRAGRYEYRFGFQNDKLNWLNVNWQEMTSAQFDAVWAGGSPASLPVKSKNIRIDGISFGWQRKAVLAKLGKPNGPIPGPRVDSFGPDPSTVVAYSSHGIVDYLYGQSLEITGKASVRTGDPVSALVKVLGVLPSEGICEFADGMLRVHADRKGHIAGFEFSPSSR